MSDMLYLKPGATDVPVPVALLAVTLPGVAADAMKGKRARARGDVVVVGRGEHAALAAA